MSAEAAIVDGGGGIPQQPDIDQPASSEQTPEVAGAYFEPNTHAYISRIAQREPNLFLEEYYSSTDTTIEFDGIEQLEIGYIQYSVQEQLKPLYGYASRTWDDVAVGNRIVTGVFKVPIRNPKTVDYNNPEQTPISKMNVTYGNIDDKTQKDLAGIQDEEVEQDVPDWVNLLTPGGSLLHVVDVSDGYYQSELPSQNLDVNHVYNGIYDRNGYLVKSEGDYPMHITDSDFPYIPENAEDFIYRQMLQELGYALENGSSALTFENQIKKFQNDMRKLGRFTDIGGYGSLTYSTKKLIREVCDEKWAEDEKIIVKEGYKLYTGPSTENQVVITMPKDCEFVVLSGAINDINGNVWYRIIARNINNNYYGYYCEELCKPEEG